MIYGTLKIQKPEVLLKTTVLCIGSPSYHLSKHIISLAFSLVRKTSCYLRNSRHFAEMVTCMWKFDNIPVRFDVSSPFNNIPVGEAVTITCERLQEDKTSLPRPNSKKCASKPPTSAMRENVSKQEAGRAICSLV